MKKSKLSLALALVLALALIFTACGEEASAPVSGQIIPAAATSEGISGEVVPATEAVEATEVPVSLGRIEGGTYINNYAGFGCELDSNWSFYTAEELQDLPSNITELLEGSELVGEDMPLQISDMKAENANDLTTVNILYQKLSMQDRLLYLNRSEEDVIDATLANSDLMISAYEQMGLIVDSMEKVTVTFLGEERVALRTASTWDGIPYYTLQLFDYHAGEYSVTTTFASYLEDNTESLLDLFFPVA